MTSALAHTSKQSNHFCLLHWLILSNLMFRFGMKHINTVLKNCRKSKEHHSNYKSRSGSHLGLDATKQAKKQALKISCHSPLKYRVSGLKVIFLVPPGRPCGGNCCSLLRVGSCHNVQTRTKRKLFEFLRLAVTGWLPPFC